jgi:hypothetical protein
VPVQYENDTYEQEFITDFSGGLNVTDPSFLLPKNQFTKLQNLVYTRLGFLEERFPFRPQTFSASIQAKPVIDTDGVGPTKIYDFQVFTCDVADWNYNGELYVMSGQFIHDATTTLRVMAYKVSTETWTCIWSSEAATKVSVCPFRLNAAFDLLIFPDTSYPERWVVGAATTTGLGLTPPAVNVFTVGFTQAAGGGLSLTTTKKVYYKYAYFYDDNNVSTKYGESSSTTLTTGSTCTPSSTATEQKITLAWTGAVPAGISKIKVYRAPENTLEGPYKYVGESIVTATVAANFVDTTPWDFEGEEDLLEGSDPTTEVLKLINVTVIGSAVLGFSVDVNGKLMWCTPGMPDVWNPLSFDYLLGNGKGVVDFNRKLYAFTDKSCYEKADAVSPAVKISNVGTVDGKSIQNVGSGIIWMDYDSVYFADFVQQYGSKGDFPKDIGHAISKDITLYDKDCVISSIFREQRYFLTFKSTETEIRFTYVYDVDFSAWTSATYNHSCIASNAENYYSLGYSSGTVAYVYKHNYQAAVSIAVGGSDYTGIDWHDYRTVTAAAWSGMEDITVLIERSGIRFGGDYKRALVSSMTLSAEAAGASITATVFDAGTGSASLLFPITSSTGGITAFAFVWGTSTWSANSSVTPDATHHAWVGTTSTRIYNHKKLQRPMKSLEFRVLISITGARKFRILLFGLYYKPLPSVA